MSSQPPRKKHPRITFSAKSSPEQGELDDDDVARKEIDAAMDRERLQVMRSKSSTSVSRSDRARDARPRDADRVIDRRGSDVRPPRDARDIANSHSRTRSPDRAARRNSQPDILRVDAREVLRKKSPERPKLTSTVVVPPLDAKSKRVVGSPSPVQDRNVRDRAGPSHQERDARLKEPAKKPKPERSRQNDDHRRRESPERREPKRGKETLPEKPRRSPEREVRPARRSDHAERKTSRDEPPKKSTSRSEQEHSESRHSTQRSDPLPEKPRKKTPASPDAPEDEKPPKKTKTESPVSGSDEEDRTSSSVSGVEEKSHDESDESGSEVSGPILGPPRPRFESTGSNLEEITEPVSAPTPEHDAASDVAAEADHSGLPFYLPGIQGCRSIEEFEVINRVEEGTYGVVYRARDKRTDQVVALKRLKMEKEKEGFPITSLREVSTLLKAHHKNVVKILEVIVGHNMDKIYMVMEFVEHDMKALMERVPQPFLIGEVKTLMQQLLSAVGHLHDNWIIHRDLKTSNLLLSHKGILKVGDFGLAREYGSPLKPYTPVVVTLWYRCPELLLGAKEYSTAVDMWSVGCIFAEFLTLKPLFPGKSEIEQINKIFKELGNPSEDNWPEYKDLPVVKLTTFPVYPTNTLRRRFPPTVLTHSGYDLLTKLLEYNPSKRIGAEEALKHIHFTDSPLPVPPSMFPTYPAKSEQGPRGPRNKTPKPPSGGKQFKDTVDADGADGFRMALPKDTHRRKGDGLGFQLRF